MQKSFKCCGSKKRSVIIGDLRRQCMMITKSPHATYCIARVNTRVLFLRLVYHFLACHVNNTPRSDFFVNVMLPRRPSFSHDMCVTLPGVFPLSLRRREECNWPVVRLVFWELRIISYYILAILFSRAFAFPHQPLPYTDSYGCSDTLGVDKVGTRFYKEY